MSDTWHLKEHPLAAMRADLPVHLPMYVDREGNGPVDEADADYYVCWCGDETCQLNRWLKDAQNLAWRKGYLDASANGLLAESGTPDADEG